MYYSFEDMEDTEINFRVGVTTYRLPIARVCHFIPYLAGYLRFHERQYKDSTTALNLSDICREIPDSYWHLFIDFVKTGKISEFILYRDEVWADASFILSKDNVIDVTCAANYLLMSHFCDALAQLLLRESLFPRYDFQSCELLLQYYTKLCQLVTVVGHELLDVVASLSSKMILHYRSIDFALRWDLYTLEHFVKRKHRFFGTEYDVFNVVCDWLNSKKKVLRSYR